MLSIFALLMRDPDLRKFPLAFLSSDLEIISVYLTIDKSV